MIDNAPGGNQDDLIEWDMNRGGCGAVTACDVCMYLAGKYVSGLFTLMTRIIFHAMTS